MTERMVVGIVILAVGVILIVGVAAAKADAFAYFCGLLVSELGAMFLVMDMVPDGIPRASVAGFFAISIAWTSVQLWKLRPKPDGSPPVSR